MCIKQNRLHWRLMLIVTDLRRCYKQHNISLFKISLMQFITIHTAINLRKTLFSAIQITPACVSLNTVTRITNTVYEWWNYRQVEYFPKQELARCLEGCLNKRRLPHSTETKMLRCFTDHQIRTKTDGTADKNSEWKLQIIEPVLVNRHLFCIDQLHNNKGRPTCT